MVDVDVGARHGGGVLVWLCSQRSLIFLLAAVDIYCFGFYFFLNTRSMCCLLLLLFVFVIFIYFVLLLLLLRAAANACHTVC